MLKHSPKDSLKNLEETMLYSKKPVYFNKTTIDRRINNEWGRKCSLDAKIIFTKAPFIQYEQILLDKNFRLHLKTVMVSKKILRMGVQKTPIQKTYKILVGPNSINIDFLGTNRQFHWLQFDWLEISLVFHKSDKHTGLYDSYNVEEAAK